MTETDETPIEQLRNNPEQASRTTNDMGVTFWVACTPRGDFVYYSSIGADPAPVTEDMAVELIDGNKPDIVSIHEVPQIDEDVIDHVL